MDTEEQKKKEKFLRDFTTMTNLMATFGKKGIIPKQEGERLVDDMMHFVSGIQSQEELEKGMEGMRNVFNRATERLKEIGTNLDAKTFHGIMTDPQLKHESKEMIINEVNPEIFRDLQFAKEFLHDMNLPERVRAAAAGHVLSEHGIADNLRDVANDATALWMLGMQNAADTKETDYLEELLDMNAPLFKAAQAYTDMLSKGHPDDLIEGERTGERLKRPPMPLRLAAITKALEAGIKDVNERADKLFDYSLKENPNMGKAFLNDLGLDNITFERKQESELTPGQKRSRETFEQMFENRFEPMTNRLRNKFMEHQRGLGAKEGTKKVERRKL